MPNENILRTWWWRHREKASLYFAHLLYVPALLFAFASSAGFFWIVLHAEESAAARGQYSAPDGLCAMSDVASEILLTFSNFDLQWNRPKYEMLEVLQLLFPCGRDSKADPGGGFGMYFASRLPGNGQDADVGEFLRTILDWDYYVEPVTPREALSRIASPASEESPIFWLESTRREADAAYIMFVSRSVNSRGTAWTNVMLIAAAEARGRVFCLVVNKPVESESEIDELMRTATHFVQRLSAPEWL